MGNKTLAPVLGTGTAVISLNGKKVLVRNVLHVPTLRTPLYSLRKHLTQRGCGFIGDDSLGGLFVYFPTFVLAVDTTKDCHLSYKPIGHKAALKDLDYVQPRCARKVIPPPPLLQQTGRASRMLVTPLSKLRLNFPPLPKIQHLCPTNHSQIQLLPSHPPPHPASKLKHHPRRFNSCQQCHVRKLSNTCTIRTLPLLLSAHATHGPVPISRSDTPLKKSIEPPVAVNSRTTNN